MKRKSIIKQGRRIALAACALMVGMGANVSCTDDVLTGQPSWLGNSIYERLQDDGNYTYVLKLIDDLDMREVLGHTGSKTLFAADDQAYEEWFKSNDWGVKNYSQLTAAQKKMLFNNSMINNAYLIELMSNVSGTPPVEGKAMRRETATSIFDSVYVMRPEEMPRTLAWKNFKARGKSIPIFKDATSAPMIHFLPAYMTYNKITSEDLSILTNGQATSANEAWVNGKKVVERDITCKNGYIQKVSGVIESSPNMADILRQHPEMAKWSELVDRFSAPYYNAEGTREYNRIFNNEDSVFTLRYFSKRSAGEEDLSRLPDGTTMAPAQLTFDPGWNHYMYANTMDYDLHYDAGAMIVPTNEALENWWNNEGRDLQDEYKEWDSIPDATLVKLINVNMLQVFSESVPSKFQYVLNDAKESLGITKDDVIACYMGCNGVIYLVNKVFAPAEYSSVAYPALAHTSTMNVIYWAIENRNFLPYLLSMDSKYALLLPNNEAMKYYLDPASYGSTSSVTSEDGESYAVDAPQQIEFRYDRTKSAAERVQASRYNTTVDENGNITQGVRAQETVSRTVINRMLDDLMDQLIIVIADKSKTLEDYVSEGYSYFKTKGGTLIRVTDNGDGHLAFEGGWQMEKKHKKLVSAAEFNKTNGRSYMLDSQMPLGATKSLYMILKEHPEYKAFLEILENDRCDLLSVKLSNKYNPGSSKLGNKNLRLFDNYNYTVFIPTNESIAQLQAENKLPRPRDLEDFNEADESIVDSLCLANGWYGSQGERAMQNHKDSVQVAVKASLNAIVSDFIRYHVMDRSVAIGMAPEANMSGNDYESMKRNPVTGRFFPLTVDFDQTHISIKDVMGNIRQVVKTEGLYNNICREYWFNGTGNTAQLFMGSDAVIHMIDQPLFYENMRDWREVVKEYLVNNKLM